MEMPSLELLGKDHGDYGAIALQTYQDRTAAGLSAGLTPHALSLEFKGDSTVTNEDALCIVEGDDWTAMAVADAHYGHEASHILISGLRQRIAAERPADVSHLAQMIADLGAGPSTSTPSECTLLVAVVDRMWGQGFGINYGDSTLRVLTREGEDRIVNTADQRYVTPTRKSLQHVGTTFSFVAEPGALVVMHTDGIDECHYRNPLTSVRPKHVVELVQAHDFTPGPFVDQLIGLAMRGINGNPGGQDNIAVIATIG